MPLYEGQVVARRQTHSIFICNRRVSCPELRVYAEVKPGVENSINPPLFPGREGEVERHR